MRGSVRADLVNIPDFHCFEIKSERDRLDRLVGQGVVYGATFDRVTLVIAKKHLLDARNIVPDWWGILLLDQDGLIWHRRAAMNQGADRRALASILSREEAVALLSEVGVKAANKTPLYALHQAVAESIPVLRLRAYLKEALPFRITDTALALPA